MDLANKIKSVSEAKVCLKFRSRWLKCFTGERETSRFTLYPIFPRNNHHAKLTVEIYLALEQLLCYLHQ